MTERPDAADVLRQIEAKIAEFDRQWNMIGIDRVAELRMARVLIRELQRERNGWESQSKMDAEWGQEQEQRAERAERRIKELEDELQKSR